MMRLWLAPRGLHIEPGRIEDAAPMARLHAGAFFSGWSAAELAAWLADPDTTPAYVACDARRNLSGFAILRLADDESELLTIVVDPRRRGQGIGASLMRATFADLLTTPVKRMFLEVDETNGPAIRLYSGLGFAEVGRRSGYYPRPDGAAATALVMRRDLG